eukprot:Tbor_TRINITY_DN5595_c0_g1::TRINITY_DN5595_c0_g1_i1::g.13301::m.13301
MSSTINHLEYRGAIISQPLRDWLARIDRVLMTMTNEDDKMRYEQWVIQMVEDAFFSGGIDSINWVQQPVALHPLSQVRPPGSFRFDTNHVLQHIPCVPPIIQHTAPPIIQHSAPPLMRSSGIMVPQTPTDVRAMLAQQCELQCPSDLLRYAFRALELLDVEVRLGRRTYSQVSLNNIITVAMKLKEKEMKCSTNGSQGLQYQQSVQSLQPPPMGSAIYHAHNIQSAPMENSSHPLTNITAPVRSQYNTSIDSNQVTKKPILAGKRTRNCVSTEEEQRRDERFQNQNYPQVIHEKPLKRTAVKIPLSDTDFFLSLTKSTEANTKPWLIGTSTVLERVYSRYEPSSADIRPKSLLPSALSFILEKSQEKGKKYLFDQLKGMRQDLVVQNIRTPFTVRVYEEHARVSLELANSSEFNQCQSALKTFYKEGLKADNGDNLVEFLVYRLLYLVLSDQEDSLASELQELELNSIDVSRTSITMDEVNKERFARAYHSKEVIMAIRLCTYIQQGDCLKIFKLVHALGARVKQLIGAYIQRRRVLWFRDVVFPSKGKSASSFILGALGFLPSSSPSELLRKTKGSNKSLETKILKEALEKRNYTSLSFLETDYTTSLAAWTQLLYELKVDTPAKFNFESDIRLSLEKRLRFLCSQDPIKGSDSALFDNSTLTNAVTRYCNFISNKVEAE